jgi:hypothetical protein
VLTSEASSLYKVHPEGIQKSEGQVSNFSKISNSVYQSNRLRKYRNVSEHNVLDNETATQFKICQALKGNSMVKNRSRIRT